MDLILRLCVLCCAFSRFLAVALCSGNAFPVYRCNEDSSLEFMRGNSHFCVSYSVTTAERSCVRGNRNDKNECVTLHQYQGSVSCPDGFTRFGLLCRNATEILLASVECDDGDVAIETLGVCQTERRWGEIDNCVGKIMILSRDQQPVG